MTMDILVGYQNLAKSKTFLRSPSLVREQAPALAIHLMENLWHLIPTAKRAATM